MSHPKLPQIWEPSKFADLPNLVALANLVAVPNLAAPNLERASNLVPNLVEVYYKLLPIIIYIHTPIRIYFKSPDLELPNLRTNPLRSP